MAQEIAHGLSQSVLFWKKRQSNTLKKLREIYLQFITSKNIYFHTSGFKQNER